MTPRAWVGFGDPELGPSHTPLPWTARELQNASRRYGGDTAAFLGKDATEAAVRAGAPGARILHFATHGEYPETDALDFHRLLLTADASHDGHLRAENVRKLDLRAAGLVVLAVCNGGTYRVGPGDEPYGLVGAFLAAGARNLVAAQWPTPDRVAYAVLSAFYEHLAAAGPAEALRRASAEIRAEGRPIRDWAAFATVGAGRPLEVT